MSTLYETGHPSWDIGQILTVHESKVHGDAVNCNRVTSLVASRNEPADVRLAKALAVPCTCERGKEMNVPSIEQTSLRKETQNASSATNETPHGTGI